MLCSSSFLGLCAEYEAYVGAAKPQQVSRWRAVAGTTDHQRLRTFVRSPPRSCAHDAAPQPLSLIW